MLTPGDIEILIADAETDHVENMIMSRDLTKGQVIHLRYLAQYIRGLEKRIEALELSHK